MTTSGLRISVDEGEDRALVTLAGFVDPSTAPELRTTLTRLVEGGQRRLEIDLRQVSFMDSSGIGALATAYKLGAAITVREPSAIVMKELVMCGLDRLLTIV